MTKQELEAFAKEAAKGLKSQQDLLDFSQMLTKITVEADVIFIGVISLPYYSLLGVILGFLLARFPKETHKCFIYGFLINFIRYFTLPFIKWDVVIMLIESAAGEKQLRYYELLFSTFYSVVSIYLAILLIEKQRKAKNRTD